MTELEQLRKEVNELRERVAKLEARPVAPPQQLFDWSRNPPVPMQPTWTQEMAKHFPPGTVLC